MVEDSRLASPTDEELVQRVRRGDEQAMNVLVGSPPWCGVSDLCGHPE